MARLAFANPTGTHCNGNECRSCSSTHFEDFVSYRLRGKGGGVKCKCSNEVVCSHLSRFLSLIEGMLIEEELKKSSNHAVQFGLQLLLQLVLLAYLSNKRQNITYGPATRTLKCYSETKS